MPQTFSRSRRWFAVVLAVVAFMNLPIHGQSNPGEADASSPPELPAIACGLVQTSWTDPEWIIATSHHILRANICVVPGDPAPTEWYDRIMATPCYPSTTKCWKFAPDATYATVSPMWALVSPGTTFDGLYVKPGYEVQLYDPNMALAGLPVVGPHYVTLTVYDWYHPAPLGFEPNTTLVSGGTGALAGYSLRIGAPSIISMSDNEALNETNHRTLRYKGDRLVLRRGQQFEIEVHVGEDFDTSCLGIGFAAMHDFDGTPATIDIPYYGSGIPSGQWGAFIAAETLQPDGTKKLTMAVEIPADAPVGEYELSASIWPPSAMLEDPVVAFPKPVVILFNPWSQDDDVFMPDESQRKEYVLATYGLIWVSSFATAPLPWRYAQWDSESLGTALFMMTGLSSADRSSPVTVARLMSRKTNWEGETGEYGILDGEWLGSFTNGTLPWDWAGSDEILYEHINSSFSPVRYGQCWVFAGVLNTLMRTLGIPSRPITNFESGHDATVPPDGYVDFYYDASGSQVNNPSGANDSLWNFHVWCDVWMERPGQVGHDGWQAIDGTPQEFSDGTYQLGPAALAAVHANSGGLYDVAFVVSEVDADIRVYRDGGSGAFALLGTPDTTTIGWNITTKTVGANSPQDITALYKVPETPPTPLVPPSVSLAVTRNVTIDAPNTIPIEVHLENSANQNRTVELTLQTKSHSYSGVVFGHIKTQTATVILPGNSSYDASFYVNSGDYLQWMTQSRHVSTSVQARIVQDDIYHIAASYCVVGIGSVSVSPASPLVQVRGDTSCSLAFVNPLAQSLHNCRLVVSVGSGALVDGIRRVEIDLGTVGLSQTILADVVLTGLELGRDLVAARFASDELGIAFGSAEFGATHSSDISLNGAVDIDDLLAIVSSWGVCSGCPADIDGSGVVDIDDLLAVINYWGWQLE